MTVLEEKCAAMRLRMLKKRGLLVRERPSLPEPTAAEPARKPPVMETCYLAAINRKGGFHWIPILQARTIA